MKAWRGKKRIAKRLNGRYFTDPRYRETLNYLLRAKKGDLIHACTGTNLRIADVEVFSRFSKNGKTAIVSEVRVLDDKGEEHLFPYCVSLPMSQEEIEEYTLSWDSPEGWERIEKWKLHDLASRIRRLKKGLPIVDDNGCPLEG